MVIIQTNEDLYEYLVHVVREYAKAGMEPDEGLAMYKLWQTLKNAQQIDDKKLANTQVEPDPDPMGDGSTL